MVVLYVKSVMRSSLTFSGLRIYIYKITAESELMKGVGESQSFNFADVSRIKI